MGCPVGAGGVPLALGVSCWHRKVCGVAVHNASGDISRWEGSVFADDSRGVDFQVQET